MEIQPNSSGLECIALTTKLLLLLASVW